MASSGKRKQGDRGRRGFLKSVALGAGAWSVPAGFNEVRGRDVSDAARREGKAPFSLTEVHYPRVFTGPYRKMLSFPLGGVGAGRVGLGGCGQLQEWWIFNRPEKGYSPAYAFPSLWVQAGNAKPVARVLEARILPPYEGPSGLGFTNVPGLPRLASSTLTGEFPLARVDFDDPELPVRVRLEAFTPFVPLEPDDSGLPVAVLRYVVSNPRGSKVKVAIAFSIDNPVGRERSRGSR